MDYNLSSRLLLDVKRIAV